MLYTHHGTEHYMNAYGENGINLLATCKRLLCIWMGLKKGSIDSFSDTMTTILNIGK